MTLQQSSTVHITDGDVLRLVPLIELDPANFYEEEKPELYEIPSGQRVQHWIDSFREIGVENFPMFDAYFGQVAVRDIHHEIILEHLAKYVHQKAADSLQETREEEENILKYFIGGLSLVYENRVILGYMCCADLSNIDEWQYVSEYRKLKWQMHWNGHPWTYVRYRDGLLEFTDYTETDIPESIRCTVSPELLKKAIEQAKTELHEFHERLEAYMMKQDSDE